jgi:hypothetical protein
LLANVQTPLYVFKIVLKGLKHETSSGCNTHETCDGRGHPLLCAQHLG